MTRFEARPSGGRVYAVVVEDVFDGVRWRKRHVRSYGALTPETERLARTHAAVRNALHELHSIALPDGGGNTPKPTTTARDQSR